MMSKTKTTDTKSAALALYPTPKAIGFAVMDTPEYICKSGYCYCLVTERRRYLRNIISFVLLHKPRVVILEEKMSRDQHRLPVMQSIFDDLETLIVKNNIKIKHYSRAAISSVFEGQNKPEIAESIAIRFPGYIQKLPRKRMDDETESPKMSEFDALSLALTHFHHTQEV